MCYFTSASTNRKSDFVKELNASYRLACLTCSFSDKELSEYFQFKKRKAGLLPLKYAVSHVGLQEDGTWVLGSNTYFSSDGEAIPAEGSQHVWLGSMFHGTGVASETRQCTIQLPLSTDPLANLLHALRTAMGHNFYSCVLTMAGMLSTECKSLHTHNGSFSGAVMALHYQSFIAKIKNCPITLAYGSSGTGKTTAIRCGLGLLGADESRFFHKVSPAKAFELCSVTSIPMGYDDPDTKTGFSSLIIDLFHGMRKGTMKGGEQVPTSTVLISSNIPPLDQDR